jgi:hypothetical protein
MSVSVPDIELNLFLLAGAKTSKKFSARIPIQVIIEIEEAVRGRKRYYTIVFIQSESDYVRALSVRENRTYLRALLDF